MMSDLLGKAISVLRATPGGWIRLAEAIPRELFSRSPAPGEWSARDCMQHLIDTERMVFPARVGYLLRGEDFPAFNPDEEGTQPATDVDSLALAKKFDRLRTESIKVLSNVKPQDLGRKAKHQELGMVTLEELINEWAAHDLMHTVQAQTSIMQPFIEGCGPWKPYFSDHVVAKGGPAA
jgi:DinB superfamily